MFTTDFLSPAMLFIALLGKFEFFSLEMPDVWCDEGAILTTTEQMGEEWGERFESRLGRSFRSLLLGSLCALPYPIISLLAVISWFWSVPLYMSVEYIWNSFREADGQLCDGERRTEGAVFQ